MFTQTFLLCVYDQSIKTTNSILLTKKHLFCLCRFVAVWFPFRAPMICSVRRARAFVAALFSLTVVTNLHVFWTMHLHERRIGNSSEFRYVCRPSDDNVFMTNAFEYLKIVSYSVLPFIIVLTLNICIIYRMARSTKIIIHNLIGKHCREIALEKQRCQRRVTYMLLVITFAWLILTAPFTLFYLIRTPTRDPKRAAINLLSKTICFILMYTNHSINFYLYCMSGRKFRNELREMLCCLRYKRQRKIKRTSHSPETPVDGYHGSPWTPMTPVICKNETQINSRKYNKEAIYG